MGYNPRGFGPSDPSLRAEERSRFVEQSPDSQQRPLGPTTRGAGGASPPPRPRRAGERPRSEEQSPDSQQGPLGPPPRGAGVASPPPRQVQQRADQPMDRSYAAGDRGWGKGGGKGPEMGRAG